jgi:hypothetical protein
VGRDVEEEHSETANMEAESNPTQKNELGRDIGEVYSVEDRQGNSHSDSCNNGISASQFQKFMSNVMKEFGDLKASIKAVSDEMTNKIEIANKNLADSLTKQFRQEHESLKKELSNKLRSDISNLTATMNKLSKDTENEVLDISHSVDIVQEQLNDKIEKEIGVTQEQIKRVSQEITTKTRELATNLTEHVTQTEIDSGAIRQEIVELGDKVNRRVTDGVRAVADSVEDYRNQITAENERYASKFQKFEQEIQAMKGTIAARLASESISFATRNTELNQVTSVKVASQNSINSPGEVSGVNLSHNMSNCSDVANSDLSLVSNATVVNTNSEMPLSRDLLHELTLLLFVDCNKQSVVAFLRDLDKFFEIKRVPESLKLPLVWHVIKEPGGGNDYRATESDESC